LLFGRVLTGLGAGLAWGATAALVARAGQRLAVVASVASGAVLLGLVMGPVFGTLVTRALGWRLSFVLAIVFGAFVFLATAATTIVELARRPMR
jgi:MFS family permease